LTQRKKIKSLKNPKKGKSLRRRVEISRLDSSSDDPQPSTSTGQGNKKFKCEICEYCSNCKAKMTYHINTHKGKRPFKCKQCLKAFSSPNILNTHRKIHSPPKYKCGLCLRMFNYKHNRDNHMKTHTGTRHYSAKTSTGKGGRKLKCDICDYCCDFKSYMLRHMNSHTDSRPFKCEVCSKTFFYLRLIFLIIKKSILHPNSNAISVRKCSILNKVEMSTLHERPHWGQTVQV